MTEYTILRFDPENGVIEVQFSNWVGAIAIPVTLDSMGMLPSAQELDALVGRYAPDPDEVARISSVASAPNHDDLSSLIGVTRIATPPASNYDFTNDTIMAAGKIVPSESIPKASVVI